MSGVYHEARPDPSTPNLRFDFDEALRAARDLWMLADRIEEFGHEGSVAAYGALAQWHGPLSDDFDARRLTFAGHAAGVGQNLRHLADMLAQQWSMARGQQNRINFARHVAERIKEDQRRDEGFQWSDIWDNPLTERWTGAEDHGRPPENPLPPTGPGFVTGWSRMHPEFGP